MADLVAELSGTAVVVRPGDTLVLAVKGPVSREYADAYIAHAQAALPGVKVFIAEANALAVYRPEAADG